MNEITLFKQTFTIRSSYYYLSPSLSEIQFVVQMIIWVQINLLCLNVFLLFLKKQLIWLGSCIANIPNADCKQMKHVLAKFKYDCNIHVAKMIEYNDIAKWRKLKMMKCDAIVCAICFVTNFAVFLHRTFKLKLTLNGKII